MITGLLGVINVATGEGLLDGQALSFVLIGVSVLQGLLRLVTSEPVFLKG